MVILLHRYTGSEDVVYGILVSGRPDDLPSVYEQSRNIHKHTSASFNFRQTQTERRVNEANGLRTFRDQQVSSRTVSVHPLQEIQKTDPGKR
jgi:hypothetical protein